MKKRIVAILMVLTMLILASCSKGAVSSSDNRVQLSLAEFTNQFNDRLDTEYNRLISWKEDDILIGEDNSTYKSYKSDIYSINTKYNVGYITILLDKAEKVVSFSISIYTDDETYSDGVNYLEIYMVPAIQTLDNKMTSESGAREILERLDIVNKEHHKEIDYLQEVENEKIDYYFRVRQTIISVGMRWSL